MDKASIINFCLSKHYVQENKALVQKNEELEDTIADLRRQVQTLTRRITNRNHRIGVLEERMEFLEYYYRRRMAMQRILVGVDGSLHVFRQNEDGVFVQVPEDPDETEDETIVEPAPEEDPQDVARRLGFETDSDEGYISDDLMRSLLNDE